MKGERQQRDVKVNGKAAPVGALVIMLLLALASIGVVYGLWSKVLAIEGTVQTGRLHARWDGAICSEFFHWPWPAEGNGEVDGKDVASTTITTDPDDSNLMIVTIDNGYPSYAVDCEVEFVNDGTIPFIIRGTSIEPGPGLTNCTLTGNQTKTLVCDQLTVVLVDGIGSQIDPGDGAGSSLRIHVEQRAGQNSVYTFAVKICVAQWNEAATAAQCFAAAPTPTPAALEAGCGTNNLLAASIPERVDGAFAGVDDDGDTQIDEPLAPAASALDCDGDGFTGVSEQAVYETSSRDQDPCGNDGWPADLFGGALSTNRLTIQDITSFVAPVLKLNTSPGDANFNARWDLLPGRGILPKYINVQDITAVVPSNLGATAHPPMFAGAPAFGQTCLWPP